MQPASQYHAVYLHGADIVAGGGYLRLVKMLLQFLI